MVKLLLLISSSFTFLFLLSGCSTPVDSSNLKTSGFYAFIDISGRVSDAEVRVSLKSGSSILASDLDLNSGDLLRASTDTDSRILSKDGFPVLGIDYVTTIPYVGGSNFTVALERNDGDNAPSSTVSMPEAFNITSPANNTTYNQNSSITIAWGPSVSNGTMTINHSETCILVSGGKGEADSSSVTVPDTGSYTIASSTLFPTFTDSYGNPESISSCDSKFKLSRTNSGTIDSNLGGGSIKASQDRWINLILN